MRQISYATLLSSTLSFSARFNCTALQCSQDKSEEKLNVVKGLTRTIPTFIVGQFLIFLCKLGGIEIRAISRNCSRAASRSSTISNARTSRPERFSDSSRLSLLSQKMSRLSLSRHCEKTPDPFKLPQESGNYRA